jgi:hypothetical protein
MPLSTQHSGQQLLPVPQAHVCRGRCCAGEGDTQQQPYWVQPCRHCRGRVAGRSVYAVPLRPHLLGGGLHTSRGCVSHP